jgi:hypothetical protein
VKLFYTGPFINAEMLVAMQSFVDSDAPDDGDLSRPAQVFVPEADYDRAYKLFYTEREDEL